jgi:predicted DNA-binding transcriptional regulator YafY
MAADYKRIDRLLKIYTLIQGERGWTNKKLATYCQTTPRTIFRDISVLRNVGIPLLTDPDTDGYFINKDYFMRPVELTFEESLALISLGQRVHDNEQIPFSSPALKALAKIRGQLPVQTVRDLDLVDDRISVKLAASATQEGFKSHYHLVRQALTGGTCLRCRYDAVSQANKDKNGYFLLKPYALFFGQRAWYVVGYHGQRSEIRTLKINRFADMQLTTQRYTIPKGFTLEKHLGNAWRMIRGTTRYAVELHFDAAFAETITDTAWHPTQAFEHHDDGSIRWTCTVDGLSEILWWILGMGAHCQVISPPELITLVREESTRMIALYADEVAKPKGSQTSSAKG